MLPVRQIHIGHFMVADGIALLADAAQRNGYVRDAQKADLERHEQTLRMLAEQLKNARLALEKNAVRHDPKLIAAE